MQLPLSFFVGLFTLSLVSSAVVMPQTMPESLQTLSDTTILQFVMLLENLENTFYHTYMDMFDDADFASASFPDWVRGRFEQIVEHEDVHNRFISDMLGPDAPQRCTYQFPVQTVQEFVALAGFLEDGAAAAYLGYSDKISAKELLTQAGSIILTETRHAAWIDSAANKGSAWSGSFVTPIDMDSVFTLLTSFTVSCPATNPSLPFAVRTPLTLDPAAPVGGQTAAVAFNVSATGVASSADALYVAFSTGLNMTFLPLHGTGGNLTVDIPTGFQGAVYSFVTNSTTTPLPSNAILTAPVILQFPFDSHVENDQK